MQERAAEVGGTLSVPSPAEGGTVVAREIAAESWRAS